MLVVISCLQPNRTQRSSPDGRERARAQLCPTAPSAHGNAIRSAGRAAGFPAGAADARLGAELGVQMVSLDFRTRTEADIRPVDTRTFFDDELPALIGERAPLAVAGARELGVEPFTVATPAGEWTLALDGDAFRVRLGNGGAAVVELDDAELADVVNDLKTP